MGENSPHRTHISNRQEDQIESAGKEEDEMHMGHIFRTRLFRHFADGDRWRTVGTAATYATTAQLWNREWHVSFPFYFRQVTTLAGDNVGENINKLTEGSVENIHATPISAATKAVG